MTRTKPDASPDLHRLFEEGQRAWPALALPFEVFAAHLGARGGPGDPFSTVRSQDLFLACACAARIRGAIELFDRVHLRPVDGYLARMRPSAAFVDEVRQALREKLFVSAGGEPPKIADYDGRGALASWVRVAALRTAIDLRRRARSAAEAAEASREEPAAVDAEARFLKQRYRRAFNAAVRDAVLALAPEQRELLRLHFVDGLTLDQLAANAGVHRATVARRIAAAREAIAQEARRLLRASLGANESEIQSLEGVMRSQIEVSLPGLLGSG